MKEKFPRQKETLLSGKFGQRWEFTLKTEVSQAVVIGNILYGFAKEFDVGRIFSVFHPGTYEVT